MHVDPDSSVLAAARGFQTELRERADEIETARKLPQDISDRFASAGFYRACVPELYGGLELPPTETAHMIELLGRADASAAWCAFIGATSGSVLAMIPESEARAIFENPNIRICGVFAPNGRAEQSETGFRVNGRWAWGSGTQNAEYVLAGCMLTKDGEILRSEGGVPQNHMMIVPAADVRFHDTWNVSGLSGTGSTDFELADVDVPQERAVGFLQRSPLERPLYAFSLFGLLSMGIAAVTLGVARAAIDELITLASAKKPSASRRTLAERPHTQANVAQAEAELRSARAFYFETIEAAWEQASSQGRTSIELRRDLRLATTHAVRASVRTVDAMYELGGGTSVYRTSPLQRMFRDVHTATQHIMVAQPTFEVVGRLLLGVETDTTQL
ncbi:MAG: alkylation response protein AidB-like acyl-CoA dehydrogenase [Hyphomicrobiaceae bacterium]|jgi:alkylation response protein AidB-like acyl-CoA dehydrogenase